MSESPVGAGPLAAIVLEVINCPKEEPVQVLANGQQIRHPQYGLGVVTESDVEKTAIEFDDHGRKLFVTGLMNAELIGEAPANPVRGKRRRKSTRKS